MHVVHIGLDMYGIYNTTASVLHVHSSSTVSFEIILIMREYFLE